MLSIIIPVANGRSAQNALASLPHAGLSSEDEILIIGDTHLPVLNIPELPAPVHLHKSASPGANTARNHGAAHAQNAILCFLDDDDAYLPQALQCLRTHITQHPEQPVWCLDCQLLSGRRAPNAPDLLTESKLMARNLAGTCSSLVIRKALFKTLNGFDPSLPSMQDWDFWLRISRITPIHVLRPPYILYTDTPTSRISTDKARQCQGLKALYRKHSTTWPLPVRLFHHARLLRIWIQQKTTA